VTIANGFGALRRVYVRPPVPADVDRWEAYGWHGAPVPEAADAEHAALRDVLATAGAEVVVGSGPVHGDPDHIYAYDPVLVTAAGTVLLRPGKEGRRGEPDVVGADLITAGLSPVGRLTQPATAEGGDMFLLDDRTLVVGLGYRTNAEGAGQLTRLLEPHGIDVMTFDLVHHHGPAECLHLMSFVSPLDADLAVAYLPMMPVRLLGLLAERGVSLVEVPDEEFPTMGPNLLALAPRVALALDGNPETRRRLEAAGVAVTTYRGDEISRKGDGGPTCLTRPLERG
jgi:N-dimethylarginine dimethylaminohydrolase